MIVIKKDAPVIPEAILWDFVLGSKHFNADDFAESPIAADVLESAIRTLNAFKADLRRVGKLEGDK